MSDNVRTSFAMAIQSWGVAIPWRASKSVLPHERQFGFRLGRVIASREFETVQVFRNDTPPHDARAALQSGA